MRIDADLLRMIHGQGLAGAFVFAWIDEWFKFTWNTMEHQLPWPSAASSGTTRWTNEQWFGLAAADPAPRSLAGGSSGRAETRCARSALRRIPAGCIFASISSTRPRGSCASGSTSCPAAPAASRLTSPDGTSDYAMVLDLDGDAGQAYVRPALDPLPLDWFPLPKGVVRMADGWNESLLSTNRAMTVPTTGEKLPYETMNAGALRRGDWDYAASDYDSLATWQVDGRDVVIRIPWLQIGMSTRRTPRARARVTAWTVRWRRWSSPVKRRVAPRRTAAR